MRKYFVIAFLLFIPQMFAQTHQINRLKIDSLKKALPFLHDSGRIDCLNEMIFRYIFLSKKDSAEYYTAIAYEEVKKLGYTHGIAKLLAIKALMESWYFNNAAKEEELARESLRWYDKTSNKEGIFIPYYRLGNALRAQGFYPEAIKNFENCYNSAKKIGDEWLMFESLYASSGVYSNMGDYEKAFELSRQSFQLALKINNEESIKLGLWNIGEMYVAIEDYPTAINYFRQVYDKNSPDIVNNCTSFKMGFAELFSLLQQYDSAMYYFNLFDTSKVSEKDLQLFLSSKGKYYFLRKEYQQALPNFLRALNYHKQFSDRGMVMGTLLEIAKTYFALQNNEAAFRYAGEALSMAHQSGARQIIRDGSQIIASVYDHRRQTDSAYFYYRQYVALKDSILTEQVKGKIAAYGPEQKIELLNKENEVQQAELQKQAILKNTLISGILVLLLLSVFIFRYIMLKRKNETHLRELAENELQLQKLESKRTHAEFQQHDTELEMQALRAQMNPHFIFNCLSSINRFILKNESEPASDYLTKFSRLIRMVLTNSKKSFIALEDELEMLRLYLEMERLRFQYSFGYNISFKNEIDPENIFIPPLLLQPFAENAIWHGLMHKQGQGHLEIALSLEKKILTCMLTDDGIGRKSAAMIKSKSAEKRKSMGLQITTERLALLNQDMDVQTFFNIEDITDGEGNATGTRVILKMHYKDLTEAFA